MKHELRIDAEVICQSEADRVLLSVVCELLAETDKHAVKPAQDVRRVVYFGLEYRYSCHKDSSGFLVKGRSDARGVRFCKVSSDRCDAQAHLPRCVLIMGDKLNETP